LRTTAGFEQNEELHWNIRTPRGGRNRRETEVMNTIAKANRIRLPLIAASLALILCCYSGPAFADFNANYISSIAMPGETPIRIAADARGILYVTVPGEGKVVRFFRDGSPAGVISVSQQPLSVAADAAGRVYVGDSLDGSVRVLSPDGGVLFSLGQGPREFRMPGDIAASSSGLIYVTDSTANVVKIYDQYGTFKSSFGGYGTGPGQMIFPSGICVDDVNHEVYVVEQTNGRVEVFDSNGVFKRSFGQGQLTRGQGIGVAGGEVYVADAYLSTVKVFDTDGTFVSSIGSYGSGEGNLKIPMDVVTIGTILYVTNSDNGRIEVFDVVDPQGLSVSPLNLSFTTYPNTAPSPQAVQVDPEVAGTDVAWTATVSGSFVTLSALSGTAPTQVEVGVTGLAVGTYTGAVIFHADGNDYPVTVSLTVVQPPTQLLVSPDSISLTYHNGSSSPQAMSVGSSGGSLLWSASTTDSWLGLSSASGTTPAIVTASVNSAVADTMNNGVYTGSLTIAAPGAAGSPQIVPVTLTVERQSLSVSPHSIDMFHQTGGDLASTDLSIGSVGGILNWNSSTDAQWMTCQPSYGSTGASVTVSLNSVADTLAEGVHTASVTVTAPDAVNSPVAVPVTLTVVKAGTIIVQSNLEATRFTISGKTASGAPVTLQGQGTDWRTDNAKPGTYTVHFDFIQGHKRPADQTFDITSGKTVSLDVQYTPMSVANVIAAAKGPSPKNDATVRLLDLDGGLISEFKALDTKYGARVAMGDIDGDGADEVIVAPGAGMRNQAYVKVFHYDGSATSVSLVTETAPAAGTVYGAAVAAGDIDGDGRAEVAMSMVDRRGAQTIIVYSFDGDSLLEKVRISPASSGGAVRAFGDLRMFRMYRNTRGNDGYPAAIAFGDIDGDGRLELICVSSGRITVYAFDSDISSIHVVASRPVPVPRKGLEDTVTLAAGDINGDGVDKVMIGYDNGRDSMVQVLSGDLTASGQPFTAFARGKSSPALSIMDCDGDGKAELLAGQGVWPTNDAVVKIYDSNGTQLQEIKAFDSGYGVNAVFGTETVEGTGDAK
jgi:sugar lactone lactonase YvrE